MKDAIFTLEERLKDLQRALKDAKEGHISTTERLEYLFNRIEHYELEIEEHKAAIRKLEDEE